MMGEVERRERERERRVGVGVVSKEVVSKEVESGALLSPQHVSSLFSSVPLLLLFI